MSGCPPGFLGAFTDDPEDLALTQRFCKELAAKGLLTLSWPEEFGGQDGSLWDQTVVREEMWAHHEPRGAQYMGLNWVGPVDHGIRDGAAKGAPPPSDRRRRTHLVSRFQRARRRI